MKDERLTEGTLDAVPGIGALLEAWVLLCVTRGVQRMCFRIVAGWMMRGVGEVARVPPTEVAGFVGRAVASASKVVPWTGGCLPDAMTGKLMLARRGYGSTIHLGVTRRSGSLAAHAWLEAGGAVVTGETGMEGVQPFPVVSR